MIFKYIRHRSKRVLGIVQEPLEKEGSQKKINSDLNSWQTRKVQSFVVFEKGKKERNKKKVWRWKNYCWLLLQFLWLQLQFSSARRKVRGILISKNSHLQFCFSHLPTNRTQPSSYFHFVLNTTRIKLMIRQ